MLRKLTSGLSRRTSEIGDLEFLDNREQVVISIGKKAFNMPDREATFADKWTQWKEYDQETAHVEQRLSEFPLKFPPTYPFEEDPSAGTKYMSTRCPAWCDRVLFSHPTREIIDEDSASASAGSSSPAVFAAAASAPLCTPRHRDYDVIGRDVCMGDHKPVFLSLRVKGGMGEVEVPPYSNLSSPMKASNLAKAGPEGEQVAAEPTAEPAKPDVRYPRVESPTYTDLLCDQGSNSPAQSAEGHAEAGKFIENESYRIKMFKETTV